MERDFRRRRLGYSQTKGIAPCALTSRTSSNTQPIQAVSTVRDLGHFLNTGFSADDSVACVAKKKSLVAFSSPCTKYLFTHILNMQYRHPSLPLRWSLWKGCATPLMRHPWWPHPHAQNGKRPSRLSMGRSFCCPHPLWASRSCLQDLTYVVIKPSASKYYRNGMFVIANASTVDTIGRTIADPVSWSSPQIPSAIFSPGLVPPYHITPLCHFCNTLGHLKLFLQLTRRINVIWFIKEHKLKAT